MTINELIAKLKLHRAVVSGLLVFLMKRDLVRVVGHKKSRRGTGALSRIYRIDPRTPRRMAVQLRQLQKTFPEPFTILDTDNYFQMPFYTGGLIRFLCHMDMAQQVGTKKTMNNMGGAPLKAYQLNQDAPQKFEAFLEELVRCNPEVERVG